MSTGASLALEPVCIGPTWQRDSEGRWLLPDPSRTLGWQVLEFTDEYFHQPDGPDAGSPWRYTLEQVRFVLWWYAIDDRGRFVYRNGVLRRSKGWGKDPVGSTLCGVELVGPCRFDGWDADGMPVAAPHPAAWVMTAAVSRDQTRNTMTLFPGLFSDALIDDYRVDLGKEIVYANGGRCRLDAVTSSPRALEGARSTFTLENEVQHWISTNEGHAMDEVINRNVVKSRDGAARALKICNAHSPGEDSVAERDWDAWQQIEQGRSRASGFLYDSLEAPPGVELADEAQLRAGLAAARGDSVWLDIDRHVQEIYDPRNSPATSRRFYLNQIVAAEDAWVAPHEFDRLEDPTLHLEDGEEVALGFDGSKTDDHSALIACRIEDGAIFTLGVWDPVSHGGEAPRDLIDAAVERAHARYEVVAFFSDLHPWESYVDKWAQQWGAGYLVRAGPKHAVAWDMRGRTKEFTFEIERLYDEIVEHAFRHDGHRELRQHFHNARRRPNAWGVSVGKEHRESSRKIDCVPPTALAKSARRLVLDSGKRRKRGPVRAMFV